MSPTFYTGVGLVDVNGDGFPDLILGGGDSSHFNKIYLNDGHGSFANSAPIALSHGCFDTVPGQSNTATIGITSGDLRRVGYPDLVLVQVPLTPFYGGGCVQILTNDGHGNFTDQSAARGAGVISNSSWYIWAVPIDVNGDGKLDLVMQPSVSLPNLVLLNDGQGNFTATPNNFFPIGTYFYMIPIDLRSNGKTAFVQPYQYIDPSTGNVEVKFAVYEPVKPMSLAASVSVSENGSGTVTSSPAGISCSNGSGACSAHVAFGTQVTLSATAASGLVFAGWSGAGCSGTGGCTLTALSAESVTATFAQSAYTLSVSETGSGAVTSSPPLINCVDSGGSWSASFAIRT